MTAAAARYPARPAERARWTLERRPGRRGVDPWKPAAVLRDKERQADGSLADVLTILLAGSECPWRCVFCDLWKRTTPERTPRGAIPVQVESALASPGGGPPRVVKLYNSGSWFDPAAVPPEDRDAVARLVSATERVVVESHPTLVRESALDFGGLLAPARLEVAMGLETSDAAVLEKLDKRMTPADFARAARFLKGNGVDVRAFVLVGTPFVPAEEAVRSAVESARFALGCGASAVTLIPVRGGNGALEALREDGDWTPPGLVRLEEAQAALLASPPGGRVFADTWDLAAVSLCPACLAPRRARLEAMNRRQAVAPPVTCAGCDRES